MTETVDIAIIGAGIIGLTTALYLAAEGREVVLIDPNTPGAGASYGNAGTIADYAVEPVGTPSVLRNLPSLLFDPNSPLAIRRAALPALAPWLLRFARASLPAAARRNAQVLATLLSDAAPLWKTLAAETGAASLLRERGCIYMFERAANRRSAEADLACRRDLGVRLDILSPDDLAELEPALPATEGGGVLFPEAIFLTDPGRAVEAVAKAALSLGVQLLPGRAEHLAIDGDRVRLSGPGLRLSARHVVIAAGAHSRALTRQAGDRIPLDTERGYHVEFDMAVPRLTRPVCTTARGFYMCPMQGRLRVAGTVELGGLTAPPSPHRIERLVDGARAMFPDLATPDRTWMGFRPSMPDSLPVIGASAEGPRVIHAYGHGHIGMTLAPRTARLVADVIAGRTDDPALPHVRPGRFRRA